MTLAWVLPKVRDWKFDFLTCLAAIQKKKTIIIIGKANGKTVPSQTEEPDGLFISTLTLASWPAETP